MTLLPSNSRPTLPTRLLAGVSKKITFNQYSNTIYGSVDWNIYELNKLYFGNSFQWNRFIFDFGFSSSKNVAESSIGIKLAIKKYEIGYGTKFGSQEIGVPKIISLRVLLP